MYVAHADTGHLCLPPATLASAGTICHAKVRTALASPFWAVFKYGGGGKRAGYGR